MHVSLERERWINMERVTLKYLVARYKQDKEFLQTYPENRELLEKRIRRHEKDIAEYVSSDSFQMILNCYNM